MKVTSSFNNYLIIDDFFNDNDLKNIWLELDFLTREEIMLPPEKSNGAVDPETKILLKKNNVIFLDTLYQQRETSNILNNFEKIYSEDVADIIDDLPNEFKYFKFVGHDRTFISYYEDSDYYKPHVDQAILSCIYWCNKSPQSFEGGDLILGDEKFKLAPILRDNSLKYSASICCLLGFVNEYGLSKYFSSMSRYGSPVPPLAGVLTGSGVLMRISS
jgi:hypothetical protein